MESWEDLNNFIQEQFDGLAGALKLIGAGLSGIVGVIAFIYMASQIVKALMSKRNDQGIDLKEVLISIFVSLVVVIIAFTLFYQMVK